MLVFDRLSTFPLTLVLLSNSPLYSLFIHFDTSCILLSSLGLSLAEYARYSPLLYYSFFALPDRPLQSTLEPWSPGAWRSPVSTTATRSSPMPSTTSSSPLTRSPLVVPRQEASPFRSCYVYASLLKSTLFPWVCTHILLLPLTLCSRAVVFEPSWPMACIKQLVLFYS